MRHAYEKAIEVATTLTVANIGHTGYGNNENAAKELAAFYLALEQELEKAFSKFPD